MLAGYSVAGVSSRVTLPPSWSIATISGRWVLCVTAALRGSRVISVDPKPDHEMARSGVVSGQIVDLSADERFVGLLDPMRIGPPEGREELVSSYLLSILPDRDVADVLAAVERRLELHG